MYRSDTARDARDATSVTGENSPAGPGRTGSVSGAAGSSEGSGDEPARFGNGGEQLRPSDETVMRSIRAGDPEALQRLMDRHWGGLHRYAERMLECPATAEDVAQEVFVRVWNHRGRWTPGGSVSAYLYRIARNQVLQRSRHRDVRERTAPEIRQRAQKVVTPLETAVHGELRQAFEEAVAELPERRREAFVLVRMRGLSLREAAEAMGVTRRTVANHVYLAATDLEAALRPFL